MEHSLSIGKFAKLCGTTVDTLIHYDNLGLLSPTRITETHRRFYDIRQYYNFCLIQHLTEIGMPLTEIKRIMQCDNLTDISALLKEKEQNLRIQLRNLQNAVMYIDDINIINSLADKDDSCRPFTYTQPEHRNLFATLIEPKPCSYSEFAEALKFHKCECDKNNVYPFPMGCIIPKKSPFEQMDRLFLFFSPLHTGIPDNKTPVQPAGEYAAVLHKGSYDSLHNSVQLLSDYISVNQYIVAGDTYITFYDNSLPEIRDSVALIKIHILKSRMPGF